MASETNPDLAVEVLLAPSHELVLPKADVHGTHGRLPGATWFVLAGLMVLLSAVAGQGADLLWGVAMGDRIRAGDGVPQSVPFAAATSDGWVNPMGLGETLLSAAHAMGPVTLVILHLTLVTLSLGVLVTHGLNRQHREARASVALTLATVGSVATLAIARMPSLSLLPFAALIALLLREADRPSWRLWLAAPLLGVWGNLHGAVLVGCALLAVHLVCCDGPTLRRVLVGTFSAAVVLLATSAGWRTTDYYRGVLSNEAARQHSGLWAQPSLNKPFDVVTLLAAAGLIAMWVRGRPQRWEVVTVIGMSAATLTASRNSIWLLLFLLPLASRGQSRANSVQQERFPWRRAVVALVLLLVGVGWQLASRGSALDAHGAGAVSTVRKLAAGRAVLAIDPVEETFAQAGIQIWAGNPIDAFPRRIQREFLAFMEKGVIPPDVSIGLIVVDAHLANNIRAAGWRQVASVDHLLIFEPPLAGGLKVNRS